MAKLLDKHFLGADFARQVFYATPAAGTTIDDVMQPDYWAHVARRMNPRDIVEVVPEDGSFYARLFVLNSDKLWAKMAKLEHVSFGEGKKPETAKSDLFEAKYAGPSAKWRVHNKSDGSLVANDSFQTRDEAEKWILQHAKQMAA